MKTPHRLLALALLAACTAPRAQDATRDAVLAPGWYVAPMASYLKADSARNVNDGAGGALLLGNRGEVASLELWAHYLSPSPAKLEGGGVDLLFGPYGDFPVLRNVFGLAGFGLQLRKGHPQYTDDSTTIFGDAGVGYFYPLHLFGRAMALRTEVRYRYDSQPPPRPAGTKASYADLVAQVGLQIPLGEPPQPPAPEPVAIVPVQEMPAPAPEPAPAPVVETPPPPPEPVGPPTLETAKAGDTIVLEGVNFETASAKLTANARTILNGVAQKLIAKPELKFEIGGHTDSRGSDGYNQKLSERRAQSVMQYLGKQGVDPARLSAVGYGEGHPVDTNDTDEGREKNRRVEVKVLESSEGKTS